MPAPTTDEDLLDLVRKCALVRPECLQAFLRDYGPLPGQPRKLARRMIRQGLLTVFQASQLLQGRYRGFYLGKYLILERLGRSGTGTVYLCEDATAGRRVVLKVLPEGQAEGAALARLAHKARTLSALNHPNLVQVYDIDQEGGIAFLVQEYIHGPNLQNLVEQKGPLGVARATQYIQQAALGLHHLHQAGLVHHGVQPSNLLVDRQGTVKLLPTEQATSPDERTIRTDIQGLGAAFHFLLTGRAPCADSLLHIPLPNDHTDAPRPIPRSGPELPDGLAAILERMLARDPEPCFTDPAAVAAALAPWVHEPVLPPAEEELPTLCLAAGGSPPPQSTTRGIPSSLVVSPADSDKGEPRPRSANGDGPPRSVRRSAQIQPASSSAATILAKVSRQPDGRQGHPGNPDASIVSVPPAANPARGPAPFAPAVPRSRWQFSWLQAGLVAGLLLVAVGIGWGIRLAVAHYALPNQNPQPEPPSDLPVVARLLNPRTGSERSFPSLAEALARVQTGDRIRVFVRVLETSLSLEGGSLPPGVTLEGVPRDGELVRWQAPAGHPAGQPLLELADVTGWTIRGFLFDGQNRLDELVTVSGRCPELTLEDVQFQDFRECGVGLANCAGSDEHPVVLLRTRFRDGADKAVALQVRGGDGAINRHLHIRDSRFEGPCRAAVEVLSGTTGLLLKGNRFFQTANGLLYNLQEEHQPFQAALESNTFREVQSALHFSQLPSPTQTRLSVTNNLFCETQRTASIDGFVAQPPAVQAKWIWFEEVVPPTPPPVVTRFFRKTFEVTALPQERAFLDIVCDNQFMVWLNGERAGIGRLHPSNGRVFSFDVTRLLRAGKNVLAVQTIHRPGPAGLLAQLAWKEPQGEMTVVSDATWLANKTRPRNWLLDSFDDTSWPAAKELAPYGAGPPTWHNLTWESMIRQQFANVPAEVLVTPAGNIRDHASNEGFPFLGSLAQSFPPLPTDPANDSEFLRYPLSSPLFKAGLNKSPVGAPPEP